MNLKIDKKIGDNFIVKNEISINKIKELIKSIKDLNGYENPSIFVEEIYLSLLKNHGYQLAFQFLQRFKFIFYKKNWQFWNENHVDGIIFFIVRYSNINNYHIILKEE